MSLGLQWDWHVLEGFPRSRGDEPERFRAAVQAAWFSPLTRG